MIEKGLIRTANLSKEAASGVRKAIFNGVLVPGERINEKSLCAALNLSRTPLREALKVLAHEGLVELLPNRGARVALISATTIDQIFPVMAALEALAGELAVIKISDDKLAEIRAEHFQMALHHARRELAEYFYHNQRIHNLIFSVGENLTLVSIYQSLAGQIRLARLHANISHERWDQAMVEHQNILEALEERDGQKLANLLREHLLRTCESLKAGLKLSI